MADTSNMEQQQVTITPEANARWLSIRQNTNLRIVFYETQNDGGFTFGVEFPRPRGNAEWRTFAVNPDGGKAYPLDY